MKFMRVEVNGRMMDVNAAHIQSLCYDPYEGHTIITLKFNQSSTAKGDWSKRFPKFMASGANWTDGQVYEYNK